MKPPCDPCAPATDCPAPDDFGYSVTSGPGYAVVTPAPAAPCQGCGAPVDCVGGTNNPDSSDYSYSLTADPTLPFFFFCPPGFSCRPSPGTSAPIYFTCCDHVAQRTITSATTDAQLSVLYQSMLDECQQYAGECANPPISPGPGGGGGGGGVGGGGGGGNPTAVYFSQEILCYYTCPDGTFYPYNVRAGISVGATQAIANSTAQLLCSQLADVSFICMGTLPSQACLNKGYDEILAITKGPGVQMPFTFSGTGFPPGISVSDASPAFPGSASVFATSITTAGDYVGVITVTSVNGLTASKSFPMSVLGITNVSLPNATVGSVYSTQLTSLGGVPPYTYSIDPTNSCSGPLTGLSLSSSGAITGTPTSLGNCNLGIIVTDSKSAQCETIFPFTVLPNGIGNQAQTASCPGNPGIIVTIPANNNVVPPGTPNGQDIANNKALAAATNLLAGLGCSCSITNDQQSDYNPSASVMSQASGFTSPTSITCYPISVSLEEYLNGVHQSSGNIFSLSVGNAYTLFQMYNISRGAFIGPPSGYTYKLYNGGVFLGSWST